MYPGWQVMSCDGRRNQDCAIWFSELLMQQSLIKIVFFGRAWVVLMVQMILRARKICLLERQVLNTLTLRTQGCQITKELAILNYYRGLPRFLVMLAHLLRYRILQ
jgi:hypothetical protein